MDNHVREDDIHASLRSLPPASMTRIIAVYTPSEAGVDVEKSSASSKTIAVNSGTTTSAETLVSQPPALVWWDGTNDPENPLNWPPQRKWGQMLLIAWLSFAAPFASTLVAPALPDIAHDMKIHSGAMATFVLTVYVFGYLVAGVIAAPMSELYGRLPLYHVSNLCFAVFSLACGFAPNAATLIALRAFTGILGTAPLQVAYGSCADIFRAEQRGKASSLVMIVLLLAPCTGPIVGGLVSATLGWRWIFYLASIVGAADGIVSVILLRESSPRIVLRRKAERLRKAGRNFRVISKLDAEQPQGKAWQTIGRAVARPLKLLCFSPIVTLLAMFSTASHGILYLLFSSIPFTFGPRYQLSTKLLGLVYLAIGLPMMLDGWTSGHVGDVWKRKNKLRDRAHTPNQTLLLRLILPGTCSMFGGLLLYGWGSYFHWHIALPLIGLAMFGYGIMLPMFCAQMCGMEYYLPYAASVAAANTVLRALAAGLLPLSGLALFQKLGAGWATTTLASGGVLTASMLLVVRFYGQAIKTRFDVRRLE